MGKTSKAAIYETHGNPAEVLRVVEQPLPAPAPDEVIVKMSAAPINPADLNSIEGKYPIKPPLPATPVILPHSFGTWREVAVMAADQLVAAPNEIEPIQAAMLKVNPITAWRM